MYKCKFYNHSFKNSFTLIFFPESRLIWKTPWYNFWKFNTYVVGVWLLYCSIYCLRYFTNTRAWGREASVYRCIYLYKKQYLYYNILEIFIIIKPVIERYASLQIYIYRKNNVSIINLNLSMLCSLKDNNLFNTI